MAHCIIVKGAKGLVGLVTERDVIGELYNSPSFVRKMKVGQLMGTSMYHVIPGTYITEANKMMLDRKIKTLGVMEAGSLVGIITQKDVVNILYSFMMSVEQNKQNIHAA